MVEPALVGVGVCAVTVLVAVFLGLFLGRGADRLFLRGGGESPSDETDAAENDQTDAPENDQTDAAENDQTDAAGAEPDEAPAEPQDA